MSRVPCHTAREYLNVPRYVNAVMYKYDTPFLCVTVICEGKKVPIPTGPFSTLKKKRKKKRERERESLLYMYEYDIPFLCVTVICERRKKKYPPLAVHPVRLTKS